jgi:GcrA cell cycle regulator
MSASSAPFWTIPENLEILKKEVETGGAASAIAARLSKRFNRRFSRNAVIGACLRHIKDLWTSSVRQSGPQRTIAPRDPKPQRLAAFKVKPTPTVKSAPVAVAPPLPKPPQVSDYGACNCKLTELEYGRCKWPIGDPRDRQFVFCGDRAVANPDGHKVYCERHTRIAYVPVDHSRRRGQK